MVFTIIIGLKGKKVAVCMSNKQANGSSVLSVRVQRSLQKHIQNMGVSTLGVGIRGFISNKASAKKCLLLLKALYFKSNMQESCISLH